MPDSKVGYPVAGISATTSARKFGADADPDDGPAKTSFASCVCNPIVSASVPFVVIGEPVTLSVKIPLGTASVSAIDVT